MNIILSAFSCHPEKGSEPGVGWNWLRELSKDNNVFCIFYSGENQQSAIKEAVSLLPYSGNIHLHPVKLPSAFDKLFLRIRFEIWQIKAFFVARAILRREKIDLIHHVTIAAWWFTGYYWLLNTPLILGPLLGGQICHKVFYSFLPLKYRIFEALRTFILSLSNKIFFNSIISIKKANLVIAGNHETYNMLSKMRKTKPIILLNATGSLFTESKKFLNENNCLNLLWISHLNHVKNFGFLIECLEILPNTINWKLKVIGGGKLFKYWESIVQQSKINDKVEFIGYIDHYHTKKYYKEADVFLFPSIREGSPTVILEAMSYGLPVIAFKQNGADIIIDKKSGVLIPIRNKKQVLDDFANAIVRIYEDVTLRYKMGEFARKRLEENFLWEKRGEQMNKIYEKYITYENPHRS